VAQRPGISVHTYDNHLQTASPSLRHLLTRGAEVFTDVDRSLWYDFIEELCERDEAACLRRVSGKKGKRSTSRGDRSNFEGDRSNFEGDRSNFEGDRGKNARAGAA
jgi:hypothetical protein